MGVSVDTFLGLAYELFEAVTYGGSGSGHFEGGSIGALSSGACRADKDNTSSSFSGLFVSETLENSTFGLLITGKVKCLGGVS